MTNALILPLQVTGIVLNVAGVIARERLRSWILITFGSVLLLACAVALRMWPLAAADAACALVAAWMWWRHRKNRGRLRAALSGKYRHVRDAMVRTLRDRRVPRLVLAPGAGCGGMA